MQRCTGRGLAHRPRTDAACEGRRMSVTHTATDAELVLDGIHAAGVTHVASLPDLNLLDLIALLERDGSIVHVPLNREEEGIGIATGVYLGGGMSAVLMQSAGLLNACN